MEGWAVGSSSHIIHTTTAGVDPDGGELRRCRVQHRRADEPRDIWFNGVDFVDAMHGWAVGEDYYDGNYWASVYATTNGGARWQLKLPGAPVPSPASSTTSSSSRRAACGSAVRTPPRATASAA